MDDNGDVFTTNDGPIRKIVLNRPDRLNAFTAKSYRALEAALSDSEEDTGVRVVVLTGAGRAFSSGVDLAAVAEEGGPLALSDAFDSLIDVLSAFTKPLLAAVHGFAVGFGATLLLHCDVVLVAEDARVRLPFTSLGMVPEAGSSALLPLLVGPQVSADVLFTSRWVDGIEAVRIGLAARSYPVGTLHEQADMLAREIASQSPEAVVATKRLIRDGRRDVVRAAMAREREGAGITRAPDAVIRER
jgi:enoyl-CoA hydratase/carnithine racemase